MGQFKHIDDPTSGAGLTPIAKVASLALATAADAAYPCGTVLPAFGELLINLSPPNPLRLTPLQSWSPGSPTDPLVPRRRDVAFAAPGHLPAPRGQNCPCGRIASRSQQGRMPDVAACL